MHFRQKLTFMALGSILTIAGYLLATLTSDVTAQSETDKSEPLIVDEIVCRKLRVVDENDKTRVKIDEDSFLGGSINVKRADGKSAVLIGEGAGGGLIMVGNADGKNVVTIHGIAGGHITVGNADGKSVVTISGIFGGCGSMRLKNASSKKVVDIGAGSDGGDIRVKNADGKSVVDIGTLSNRGYIEVNGGWIGVDDGYMNVDFADGTTAVLIGRNDGDNGGLVSVYGKEGGEAQLSANEHGGLLGIYGKTDDKSRVLIGINEKGHGTINTWDKNRYRTRP